MFDSQQSTATPDEIVRLVDWLEKEQFEAYRTSARTSLRTATEAVSVLVNYSSTPQGAPWHTEGPWLSDHIARILFVLEAVVHEGGLLRVEEFAREKDLALEVEALEKTICTNVDFLRAFALVHDSAKPEMLTFDAKLHTKGAAEGFALKRHPTAPELARYDKLLRAFSAQHPQLSVSNMLTMFFAEYGIETHYDQHGPRAASGEYAPVREAILRHTGVSLSYAKLLAELLRYHIDVLFHVSADTYRLIAARAGKAGLNVDLVLDLTLAHVFVDAVAGSLSSGGAQTDLVIRHMRAEREAFPQRHEARVLAKQREAKQAQKDILASVGLEGDEVFRLLGTPFGPERGPIMHTIYGAIRDRDAVIDFGKHTEEIARRITLARERLSLTV